MAVSLPSIPLPFTAVPRYLDFGGDQTPPLGGKQQRFARLGSRWALDVTYLAMGKPYAEAFLAARFKARVTGSTVQMGWPQPAVGAAAAGAGAQVNGANQAGSTLSIKNCAGGTIPAGSFFSVVVSGRNYLYVVTDAALLAAGAATVNIAPMLRASPANNVALAFVAPQIEGFIQGQAEDWSLERVAWSTLKFSLQEIE